MTNPEYPFIQYQTFDNQIDYKFFSLTDNLEDGEIKSKWFENTPYGISFKILTVDNKYITITLHENGRLEYKVTWKEIDYANIDDVINTYEITRNLLKKINSENKKIKFMMPPNDKFKFAFINSIQQFTIPEKFIINHNDLSEFSRLFFPYVSLVIEPRKRISKKFNVDKSEKISKYGTYLRYKRISKYDNRIKMHLRILYFLRNYEISDQVLLDEISKQFNITESFTIKEIEYVKEKYSKVIKSGGKLLKKIKLLPKSKPPGIGIDIQGRDRDKYKIRITGARNKEQLDEIIYFMKILIFLYTETYLYKKNEYQKLKETLKKLSNIASRRNKVIEIVDYEVEKDNIRSITSVDKKRLGFKPVKGQSQWSRSCQNSGNDKKRRPDIFNEDNLEKLIDKGYKLNNKTGYYEKSVEVKIKNKVSTVNIRAIKLLGDNDRYNYYTCNPAKNIEHFYIGFLSRGNNPSDLCMPCCFKKDQLLSNNREKKNYYLSCLGEKPNISDTRKINTDQIILGDKVYILQETNKLQHGRFIFLPKYLDMFFNKVWNHDNKIRNHYLYESKTGYYFKYTIKHDKYDFIAALSAIFEKNITEIIDLVIKFITNDVDNIYFTYLNNGNIRELFKTRENFINYIKTSSRIDYTIIGELVSIPGVLSNKGLYFFILEKNNLVIKKILEKDKIVERYYISFLNFENNFMIDEDREFIILIKDNTFFHPIFKIQKDESKDKKMKLEKVYTNNNKQIKELTKYNNISYNKELINKIIGNYMLFGKNIITLLDGKIKIKKQYIDNQNKTKYLLLENKVYLPVFPSGISYDIKFDFIYNITKLLKYNEIIPELVKINSILNMEYIPKMLFYDKIEKNKIRIVSIYLENELIIHVDPELVYEKDLKNYGIPIKFQSIEETINTAIEDYNKNPVKIIDQRLQRVKQHLFNNEAYNIYRLELSLFLELNNKIKNDIINIVRTFKQTLTDKKNTLRKLLFNITNNKLAKKLNNTEETNFIANIQDNLPNLEEYNIENLRDYCEINKTKDKCNIKPHCNWNNNTCKILLTESLAVQFVNKIIEEMIQDNIQFKELIQENNYYVSDIVDYSQYTYRTNQKIIRSTNFNLQKIMSELFGKHNVPITGHCLTNKRQSNETIEDYPELVVLGKQLYQTIIPNKDSIIRAFVNCYYWINNSLYDIESRNLGYFTNMQTLLTNRFKARIIDYIQNIKNENDLAYSKYLNKYFDNDKNFFNSSLNKFRKQYNNTNCKVELLVLSLITDYRIVVYNNYNVVIYLFLQGEIEITEENVSNFIKEEYKNKTIFIKLDFDDNNKIPKNISSIYYY